MGSHKPKTVTKFPQEGNTPSAEKGAGWFSGLFGIFRKGGSIKRTVTKTTVYEFKVADGDHSHP